jgi:hypothetical protein
MKLMCPKIHITFSQVFLKMHMKLTCINLDICQQLIERIGESLDENFVNILSL